MATSFNCTIRDVENNKEYVFTKEELEICHYGIVFERGAYFEISKTIGSTGISIEDMVLEISGKELEIEVFDENGKTIKTLKGKSARYTLDGNSVEDILERVFITVFK
jgi:hypothetical protein